MSKLNNSPVDPQDVRYILQEILEGYGIGEPEYYLTLDHPDVKAIQDLVDQAERSGRVMEAAFLNGAYNDTFTKARLNALREALPNKQGNPSAASTDANPANPQKGDGN